MLDVTYAPDVPTKLVDELEHHVRRLGVPLDAVEAIGQSLDLVEAFIVAAERGLGFEFAMDARDGVPAPTHGAAAFGPTLVDPVTGVTA
jgi:hypothetical protein